MSNRWLLLLVLISTQLCSQSISHWRDLWLTPDQQAQALMQQGEVKLAADKFNNPEWRAAASYRAGDYQQALQFYKSLQTENGFYNTGNALAKLGQYQEALDAYKAALTLNPNNQDAQYNSELMQKLLKQAKEEQQKKRQGNNGQQQDHNKNTPDSKQEKPQHEPDKAASKDEVKHPTKPEDREKKASSSNAQSQEASQPNTKSKAAEQQQQSTQSETSKNDAIQTRKLADAPSTTNKETQQAKQQWLQLIPDDPSGLIREKFLRDHLRRHQG